ncbi:MAG: CHASE2 domain-containing protein [Elusimicrobia bacterium]|nr:CHASE2 domain-containing protein [Elusimicrobiota bacterium]
MSEKLFFWREKGREGGSAPAVKRAGKKHQARLFIAAPIIAVVRLLYLAGLLRGLDYSYLDFLFNLRLVVWGIQPIDERLMLAAIDNKSIEEIGNVPWPRSVYAKLIDELFRNGAGLVVFDVLFPEPDKRFPEEDAALVAATRRWKDRTIHCFYEEVGAAEKSGIITVRQMMPFEKLKAVGTRVAFVDDNKIEGSKIELSNDSDGTRRRTFLAKRTASGEIALSLGAEAFAALKGINADKFAGNYPDEVQINFPGIIKTITQGQKVIIDEPYRRLPIADIIAKRLKPEEKKLLKGAIIFIDSTATGYYDHHPTPYQPKTPGVGIHLYALSNLLEGNYLKVLSSFLTFILIIGIGFLLAASLERYSAGVNFVVLAAVFLGLFGTSVYLFVYQNIVFHILAPFLSSFLVLAAVTLYRVAVEEKEKRWIRSTFGQYLSPKVVALLVENPDAMKLGGEKRLMTVLFLDIEGFTTISEKTPPEELTKLLNKYLTMFTDVILKYDGMVDKFIGDAVMALWNAPFEQSQHPVSACLAALEIQENIEKMSAGEAIPIRVRVGIHTGYMIVGNMGSAARFSYTAVGDNVNFASRLEGANKFFKTSILASESVYEVSRDNIAAREIGDVRVVGKETPVKIFELIGKRNGKADHRLESLPVWEKALAAMRSGNFEEAKKGFWDYLDRRAKDPAAERYLKLLELGVKDNFVINLTEK